MHSKPSAPTSSLPSQLMRRPGDALRHYLMMIVLWNLKHRPASGYALAKSLAADGLPVMAPARLYPILKQASSRGWVTGQARNVGQRQSIVYSITPAGEALIVRMRASFFLGPTRLLFRYLSGGPGPKARKTSA